VRNYEMVRFQPMAANLGERQQGPSPAIAGGLWMIDHAGSTVLRCRCLNAPATGMRLCVPAGYGVAVGQRYELRGRVPGERPPTVLRAIVASWVTVVQTQNMTEEDGDRLDVGVAVDLVEPTPMCAPRPVASRSVGPASCDQAALHIAGRHGKLPATVGPGACHRREVTLGSTSWRYMPCHENAPRSWLADRPLFTVTPTKHACASTTASHASARSGNEPTRSL
jgi:hypothetical protein